MGVKKLINMTCDLCEKLESIDIDLVDAEDQRTEGWINLTVNESNGPENYMVCSFECLRKLIHSMEGSDNVVSDKK